MPDTYISIFIVLIPGIFALLGALVGGYATSNFNFRNQIKDVKYRNRQQAYSQIMGHKYLLPQLYVSRFEAMIFSDYHEQRWKLGGNLSNSLDPSEAQRWMHKSEDLVLEVARTNKFLFESIGLARASFRQDELLEKLTQRICQFRTPSIEPPTAMNAEELDTWKAKAVAQLQQLVAEEIGGPIDTLLEYLQLHINDDLL